MSVEIPVYGVDNLAARKDKLAKQDWKVVARPGYQGKKRFKNEERWNREYGEGNWKYAWELSNGKMITYDELLWGIYVPGYVNYFLGGKLSEAFYLTSNYSYCYDKDEITKEQAFEPYALYLKPGIANQYHHVALNWALEYSLGLPFEKGKAPIQVREGKPQPEGWHWSPGRIPAVRSDLIPARNIVNPWWQEGTIEDLNQKAKVILAKY